MNFKEFEGIVRTVYKYIQQESAYLESLPCSLRGYHTDNPQTNAFYGITQFLMHELFKTHEHLEEDVNWFLYEWPNLIKFSGNTEPHVVVLQKDLSKKEYFFKDVNDYLSYLKECYFEEK